MLLSLSDGAIRPTLHVRNDGIEHADRGTKYVLLSSFTARPNLVGVPDLVTLPLIL